MTWIALRTAIYVYMEALLNDNYKRIQKKINTFKKYSIFSEFNRFSSPTSW